MSGKIAKSIRSNILVGLILVTPVVITIFIVNALFRFVTKWVIAFVPPHLLKEYPALLFQAAALVLVIVMFFFVGLFVRNFIGHKLYRLGDMVLGRIPIFNKIYLSIRQISEALVDQSQSLFKEVVLLEYPRKGIYSMGFVTAQVPRSMTSMLPAPHTDKDMIAIFIPTTPNPTSGLFIFAPRAELISLPISITDAMKLVISGGAVFPGVGPIDSRPTLLDKLENWLARDTPDGDKPPANPS
jgi:uncharacterized membrane protein